jgi:hypothetical protein
LTLFEKWFLHIPTKQLSSLYYDIDMCYLSRCLLGVHSILVGFVCYHHWQWLFEIVQWKERQSIGSWECVLNHSIINLFIHLLHTWCRSLMLSSTLSVAVQRTKGIRKWMWFISGTSSPNVRATIISTIYLYFLFLYLFKIIIFTMNH